MNRKLDFKSPRFVKFGANLAQFDTKYDIPCPRGDQSNLIETRQGELKKRQIGQAAREIISAKTFQLSHESLSIYFQADR